MRWVTISLTVGVTLLASFLFAYNFINRPISEIVKVSEPKVFGLNYGERLLLINVTVKNNGFDGSIKVYAEFGYLEHPREVREELVYLARGESELVQFAYSSSYPLEDGGVYDTWAQADAPLQQITMVVSVLIAILGSVSATLQLFFTRKKSTSKASTT